MRWKTAALCALALAGTLGCPHAFGRGGTIDRATLKDLEEHLATTKCTQDQLDLYCGMGADIERCLQECG
jgi:hypothetical protein